MTDCNTCKHESLMPDESPCKECLADTCPDCGRLLDDGCNCKSIGQEEADDWYLQVENPGVRAINFNNSLR